MTPRKVTDLPATGATAARRARAKPTILIAEDSADSREVLQLLLQSKGYEVVLAEDGVQAIKVASQQPPDLVLIDLELPNVDGITVTKKLRGQREFKKVPIVILSGHDPLKYRDQALAAGCNEYLLKPIEFDRLDGLLRELIPVATAE